MQLCKYSCGVDDSADWDVEDSCNLSIIQGGPICASPDGRLYFVDYDSKTAMYCIKSLELGKDPESAILLCHAHPKFISKIQAKDIRTTSDLQA